jgi:3-hydroxyacyl-CoA dehydrogenase
MGSINRRMVFQASLDKKQEPIPEITNIKQANSVAQMVEDLLSKHKVLSSNPSVAKINNSLR